MPASKLPDSEWLKIRGDYEAGLPHVELATAHGGLPAFFLNIVSENQTITSVHVGFALFSARTECVCARSVPYHGYRCYHGHQLLITEQSWRASRSATFLSLFHRMMTGSCETGCR